MNKNNYNYGVCKKCGKILVVPSKSYLCENCKDKRNKNVGIGVAATVALTTAVTFIKKMFSGKDN